MAIFRMVAYIFLSLPICLADDAAVMRKLGNSLSSAPSDWKGSVVCDWTGVQCDNSGRVTHISLASKGLSGILPSEINELTQLQILSLQVNSLSGPFPSFANLSFLREVYLDNNSFNAVPSDFLQGLTSLQTVSLSHNNLEPWTIPEGLIQSSSLVTFSVSNANIRGTIPDIFSSLPNLQNLRLSYNNLTGSLPPSFAGSQIQALWLNNQDLGLSGTIQVLANMTQLKQVWLHKNAFTGPIPELSECKSLFDLQLRDNQFTGLVPYSLMSLPTLVNVTLQNNLLQGPLPVFGKNVKVTLGTTNSFCRTDPGPCDPQVSALLEIIGALGYPTTLAQSWQGNSACQGWTFVTCSADGNVVTIIFGKQKFTGTISPTFANLTSLKNLYLNDNNLTGPIPDSLTGLKQLLVLDVSNNNLSGKIPTFQSTVKLVTTGNLLLGSELVPPASGGGSSTGISQGGSSSRGSSISPVALTGIAVVALILIGIAGLICYRCYMKGKHPKFGEVKYTPTAQEVVKNGISSTVAVANGLSADLNSHSSSDLNDIQVFEGGKFTISIEVLRQVTNNFSEENILGRGGFGVVYKGELHDGTEVAVKRMVSASMGSKGMDEFQAEIAVLTKVRHRHLVALLGFCINGNERLLVYEYMPKGTLAQHLFEWKDLGLPTLTWKQRVTIALDVARGIEYLHSLAQQSFIHRDLKPSNILLGNDMRAKVADFGLVKNAPDGKYSMETRLAGTFGYLAPEYAATGRVTTKVDVYAFGVILMELITGRKALDGNMPDEKSYLVTWFRRVLLNKDNLPKAIDENLRMDDSTCESILKVAELAGHCTAREPFQRPDMGHAVNVLGPLVELWKPTDCAEENDGMDLRMSLPDVLQRWQANANEGTSAMFSDFYTESHTSIPPKPPGFGNTFGSVDGR